MSVHSHPGRLLVKYSALRHHSVVVEVLVINTVSVSTSGTGLVVRVHEGALRVGDYLTYAEEPDGRRTAIDVEVVSIALTESVQADSLETNYGGLITVIGNHPDRIGPDWVLGAS